MDGATARNNGLIQTACFHLNKSDCGLLMCHFHLHTAVLSFLHIPFPIVSAVFPVESYLCLGLLLAQPLSRSNFASSLIAGMSDVRLASLGNFNHRIAACTERAISQK